MIDAITFVRGDKKESEDVRRFCEYEEANVVIVLFDTELEEMWRYHKTDGWVKLDPILTEIFRSGFFPNIFGQYEYRFKTNILDAEVLLKATAMQAAHAATILNSKKDSEKPAPSSDTKKSEPKAASRSTKKSSATRTKSSSEKKETKAKTASKKKPEKKESSKKTTSQVSTKKTAKKKSTSK